jgi:hypothetical protein
MSTTALLWVCFSNAGALVLAGWWIRRPRAEPGDIGVLIAGVVTIVLWKAVTVFEDLTRPRARPRWYAIVDGPSGIGKKRYAWTDWGAYRRGVRALNRDVIRAYVWQEATRRGWDR